VRCQFTRESEYRRARPGFRWFVNSGDQPNFTYLPRDTVFGARFLVPLFAHILVDSASRERFTSRCFWLAWRLTARPACFLLRPEATAVKRPVDMLWKVIKRSLLFYHYA